MSELFRIGYSQMQISLLNIMQMHKNGHSHDGAFLFDTQESLSQGMNLVHKHFAHFGLEMHIGRNGGKSKMECVFFPPPPILPIASAAGDRWQSTTDLEHGNKDVEGHTTTLLSC